MKKAVVKKDQKLPANVFGESTGAGFENADKDSYAIPFLAILQANSPQLRKSKAEFIKGAKEGQIFNTVTGDLFDDLLVVPVHFERRFIEWTPRDEGGGLVAIYDTAEGLRQMASTEVNDKNTPILPNGNELRDTRMHYVLTADYDLCVISMTSTQMKKSRKWMSQMRSTKVAGKAGPVTPDMFTHVYKLSTGDESNEKGDWSGWVIERVGFIKTKTEYTEGMNAYKQINTGAAKADFKQIEEQEPTEEDTPF